MDAPAIGICAAVERVSWGVWDSYEVTLTPRAYVRAVQRAGGLAIVLPPDEAAVSEPDAFLDRVDGLLLAGGADIDPASYGAETHPETRGTWPDRDRFELALARRALQRDMPVLGICRGMQLLNVALGGTLIQHLPETIGSEAHRTVAGTFSEHHVRLEPDSLACTAAGVESFVAWSHHHQGVDRVGEGLNVTGWSAEDELPEAIELPGKRFALGVIWHPEEDESSRVIAALVHSSRPTGRYVASGMTNRPVGGEGGRGVSAIEVIEPGTEQVMATVPRAGAEEVDAAVARAKAAFEAWRAVVPADRARLLRGLADGLEERREDLARLEARNAGKPIVDARDEMGMVVDTYRYYAGGPERLLGQTIPVAGGVDMTFREPLGVVGLIVPWNFPLVIASWKIAPALAAGNCVVLKPAELTPLTALELERIALDAGLPAGVLNVVAGPGSVCGRRLVEHPDVAKVAFTGSTEVGRRIAASAAETIKRVTLELGGKSANVVFADADLEAAAAAAPGAVFGNAGQDCCARSRILVERTALDDFLAALKPAVEGVAVGDPLAEETEMGPLISAARREAVASYVPAGAPVAIRGSAPGGPGYWYPPTVLSPVSNQDRPAAEEIFGPVACVIPFADEEEAVRLANDTIYGLSGSIWTGSGARALRVARALETGVISINSNTSVRVSTPFGGFKQSGLGRELGPDALDRYTEVKNVYYATEEG
jgi:acyl-CoA reductase-like NAD-dependent aldehyde dehydrogenase/gamma-glutamyl-gamma-aminobutyrate hydrolase PuuD